MTARKAVAAKAKTARASNRPTKLARPGLLTPSEIATRDRVSTAEVRQWIASGDLPAIPMGRRVYVTKPAYARFAERRDTGVSLEAQAARDVWGAKTLTPTRAKPPKSPTPKKTEKKTDRGSYAGVAGQVYGRTPEETAGYIEGERSSLTNRAPIQVGRTFDVRVTHKARPGIPPGRIVLTEHDPTGPAATYLLTREASAHLRDQLERAERRAAKALKQ